MLKPFYLFVLRLGRCVVGESQPFLSMEIIDLWLLESLFHHVQMDKERIHLQETQNLLKMNPSQSQLLFLASALAGAAEFFSWYSPSQTQDRGEALD